MSYYKTIGYIFNLWRTNGKNWWYRKDNKWILFDKPNRKDADLSEVLEEDLFMDML